MRPSRLALWYAAIATTWIAFSDGALLWLGLPEEALVTYSFVKGLGFVLVTSVSLYLLGDHVDRMSSRREREYRELFELNPNPMWFYDLKTLAFLKVNDAAVEKYGYSPEEFAEMTIADIRPPEDIDRLHANVAAVLAGSAHDASESGAWRHVTKDGRLLWVDITSHRADFDGRAAEVVLVRDLTEAQSARREVARLQHEVLAQGRRPGTAEAEEGES
jgi:PAS domain S-box-containing protein